MISIIIPTLNEASTIAKTVHSFDAMTLPHEIIVSDGKSTDTTAAIAGASGARVVAYHGDVRQTIAMGRNDGAKIATGDFFVFFDADCVIPHPDEFFTHALSFFEKDPELVGLAAFLKVLPENETIADRLIFGIVNVNLWILNNIFGRGEATGEFQMIRRNAFEQLHGFREDLVTREDADMFARLGRIGTTRHTWALTVFHTGRRAHAIGWPKLLWIWTKNIVTFSLFDTASSSEWTPIR